MFASPVVTNHGLIANCTVSRIKSGRRSPRGGARAFAFEFFRSQPKWLQDPIPFLFVWSTKRTKTRQSESDTYCSRTCASWSRCSSGCGRPQGRCRHENSKTPLRRAKRLPDDVEAHSKGMPKNDESVEDGVTSAASR